MNDKTFSFVGVSFFNGEYKVRYANSKSRAKVLEKNGHSDIQMVSLKESLPKEDCVDYLLDITFPNKDVNEAVIKEARSLGFLV
jgi:hypothetical protein